MSPSILTRIAASAPPARNGRVNACEHNETFGVQRDGTMTELAAVPWQKVVTADGLSVRDCALVEPMSVGFHAVSRAQVTDIDTVMVIGCGMIGLGAIVRAALRGAKVIAVDLDDEKLGGTFVGGNLPSQFQNRGCTCPADGIHRRLRPGRGD